MQRKSSKGLRHSIDVPEVVSTWYQTWSWKGKVRERKILGVVGAGREEVVGAFMGE